MTSRTHMGRTGEGYNDTVGILIGDRVLSVSCDGSLVTFMEECDGVFSEIMSKDDAIASLQDIIRYIENTPSPSISRPTGR